MKYFILIIFLFSFNLSSNELIEAVKRDDLSEVKKLIENESITVNQKDHHGNAALHYLSIHGNLQIATYLITEGADLNISDKYGNTPLHLSVMNMNLKMFDLLIKHNAHIYAKNSGGNDVSDILNSYEKDRRLSSLKLEVSFKKIPDPFNLWKEELKRVLNN